MDADGQPALKVSFNRPRPRSQQARVSEVENFLLAVVARFKAFKKRVLSYSNSK